MEDFLVGFVGKTDLGEFDSSPHMAYLHSARVLDAAIRVQDLKDPAGFILLPKTWSFGTVEDTVSRESEFKGFAI